MIAASAAGPSGPIESAGLVLVMVASAVASRSRWAMISIDLPGSSEKCLTGDRGLCTNGPVDAKLAPMIAVSVSSWKLALSQSRFSSLQVPLGSFIGTSCSKPLSGTLTGLADERALCSALSSAKAGYFNPNSAGSSTGPVPKSA